MAVSNVTAYVKDGQLQETTASSLSLSTQKTESSSSLDKEAFLQLLVAQMKYQDPLEPTDNTEYVSQLATFSELEEMQNMVASNELSRASGLVGQEVICKVTNSSTGASEYVQGTVDYVVYENNKAYISIDESLYSVDDVHQIVDKDYKEAYELAQKFVSALSSFPGVDNLTTDYEEALTTLRETYNGMNAYQKSFIATDVVTLLEKYEEKLSEIKLVASNAATGTNEE